MVHRLNGISVAGYTQAVLLCFVLTQSLLVGAYIRTTRAQPMLLHFPKHVLHLAWWCQASETGSIPQLLANEGSHV